MSYCMLNCGQIELIRRFLQHTPEHGFRMTRYFGFLANRVVGETLPTVQCSGYGAPPRACSPDSMRSDDQKFFKSGSL
ncbi:transposase [Vibrio hyugaensis]